MFKHILVPIDVDNTQVSAGAMSIAKNLADLMGARLTVTSVIDNVDKRRGVSADQIAASLDDFAKQHTGSGVTVSAQVTSSGSVSSGILEAVEQTGADLIVMASHDPTQTKFPIGSHASHVAEHTHCSVMIVR